MEFMYSNILKDHTMATETISLDLPVNPLSHLIITIEGYNVTDEATWAEIIAFINEVTVTHRGNSIVNLESEDLAYLQTVLGLGVPVLTQNIATDNKNRELTLIIPFGRTLFNPDECFFATKKGELQLKVDTTIPSSSLDNGVINIEACELFGATPSQYMKTTLFNIAAPGGTGDNDVSLPIGNDIAKVLLFSTTVPGTSSHTWGINEAKVMVDNSEFGYVSAKAKCLAGFNSIYGLGKNHNIGAYGDVIPNNYFCLDYDFGSSGQFLLKTSGKSSVKVRLNMGVDEASKIIPIEIVSITG